MCADVFKLFGPLAATVGEQPVGPFRGVKVQALLAYLAFEAAAVHSRTSLAHLLWPEANAQQGPGALRVTLYRLRKALDEAAPGSSDRLLTITRETVRFQPEHASVDVLEFQECLQRVAAHDHAAPAACPTCLADLTLAVELVHGDLLAGLDVPDAPPFDEWLLLRRERLRLQVLDALEILTTAYVEQGDHARAYAYAARQIELDPLRESAHRQLMRILALQGNVNAAREHFAGMQRLFAAELGATPEAATMRLWEQIRSGGLVAEDSAPTVLLAAPAGTPEGQGGAPPVTGPFFGRAREQTRLVQWLSGECRAVAILGMGGMGKTTLATHVAAALSTRYERVVWRTLLNAPPLDELLRDLLGSDYRLQPHEIPASLDQQLALLAHHVHQTRTLLVLDNFESILDGAHPGTYLPGYTPYGQLLARIALHDHPSALLLTSRERPPGYARLEEDLPQVRSLRLAGLDTAAGYQLLADRGLADSPEQDAELVRRYSGNPLALKLVAETVDEIYLGNVAEFLADDTVVFDDIRTVLDQQFARLAPLEQEILFWLAVSRAPVSLAQLRDDLLEPPQRQLIEALRSLQRRSLLERGAGGFALQHVVTEYLTDRLVEQVSQEIAAATPDLLQRIALLQADAEDYIRQSQARVVLAPLARRLPALVAQDPTHFPRLLDLLRRSGIRQRGYAAGNILDLLLYMDVDLTGYDFSGLSVWQAYLQGAHLQDVNFSFADLQGSVFSQSFGLVWSVAYSPDGRMVAAGTANGLVQIRHVDSGQLLASWPGHSGAVYAVAFSPDGELIASGGADGTVVLWKTDAVKAATQQETSVTPPTHRPPEADHVTNHIVRQLRGQTAAVRHLAFSPVKDARLNSWTLACSGEDRTVHVWAVDTGVLVRVLRGHLGLVVATAFSPDGRLLATGSRGNASDLRLWDAATGDLLHMLDLGEWVLAVAFSPDGRLLAVGRSDGAVQILAVRALLRGEPADTGQVTVLGRHDGGVETLDFSPDGRTLASGGSDRMVRLWDVAARQLRITLAGHNGWVMGVAFSPDGQRLVSGGWDQSVRFWSPQTGQLLRTFHGGRNGVTCVAFAPDSRSLACTTTDGAVRVWDVAAGKVAATLLGHEEMAWRVAYSPDGRTLASTSFDGTVRTWDSRTGVTRATWREHAAGTHGVAFAPDGRRLATTCLDGTLLLTDLDVEPPVHRRFEGHTGWCLSAAFSPDGGTLATSGADHLIILRDAATGTLRRVLSGHANGVQEIVFSPDGALLASACWDGTVHLWDVATGEVERVLRGHTDLAQGIAFSPDGRLLASSSYDGTIRLWDVASGRLRHVLSGHTGWVHFVAFSPDGRLLASGSADASIRLWESAGGVCAATWPIPGPYAGMNITGVSGITAAQRASLLALGALDDGGA
ncbi:MAG: pentapeptide repeat-containing protein [Caldilineaceae bacterium]|nr:pentapeptide repeat-containing protein [Caldilineaceae bacterium]